jgi:LacI family transcriptional regulator
LSERRPTIDDVAALAGVARVTVSRVLNGNPNVSTEVRERVAQAVATLQYKVNVQARALAGGRPQVIAVVFATDVDTEPNSFYQSGLELGALRACTETGFQLLTHAVNQTVPDPASRILELIDQGRCDGLILTPPFSDDVELLDRLVERRIPVACVSAGAAGRARAAGVRIDDEAAGYDLARRLLDLGHRRFGFIRGPERHLSADERFAGFQRALAEAGLGPEAYAEARGAFTFRSGVELLPVLVRSPVQPTAIICGNDDMAVGAMFSAHKLNLTAPGDISIAGFDDTPVSEVVWPPLTTIHHPLKAIGYKAAKLVFGQVENPGTGTAPVDEIVPHMLVERESTAPPSSRLRPDRPALIADPSLAEQ